MAQHLHHEYVRTNKQNDRNCLTSKNTKTMLITTMSTMTTMSGSFNYFFSQYHSSYHSIHRRESALNEIAVKPLTHFPEISTFIDDDHHHQEERTTGDESGRLSTEGHLQRLPAKSSSPGPRKGVSSSAGGPIIPSTSSSTAANFNRTSLPHPCLTTSRTTTSSFSSYVQQPCPPSVQESRVRVGSRSSTEVGDISSNSESGSSSSIRGSRSREELMKAADEEVTPPSSLLVDPSSKHSFDNPDAQSLPLLVLQDLDTDLHPHPSLFGCSVDPSSSSKGSLVPHFPSKSRQTISLCKECRSTASSLSPSVSNSNQRPSQTHQQLQLTTKSPTKCAACSRTLRRHHSSSSSKIRAEGPSNITNVSSFSTAIATTVSGIPSSCITGARAPSSSNEPVIDPRICPIIPGKETLIELINRSKVGLGWSIVGGSDTPLVSQLPFHVFSRLSFMECLFPSLLILLSSYFFDPSI